MKVIRTFAVLPMLAVIAASPPADPSFDAATALSRDLSVQFQQELGGALQSAIKAQGTAGAVTACATIAPEVAARLSAESGASVRRTALRNRNPLAAPDDYERTIMAALASVPAGQRAESAGWTGIGDSRRFRYLRAIPTAPLCLSCHGSAIAPDVATAIAAAYPADKATGFATGDMRGAFSISWTADALKTALTRTAAKGSIYP
jgi:hypothetical protein